MSLIGPAIDERVAQVDANGAVSYIHTDRQSSVIALSDLAGNVTHRRGYGTFGETDPIQMTGTGAQGHPFGYTGRRWDPDLNLYYYRARWYDPELGTFLQTDPIGSLDYVNLYSYLGMEPGNGTDPSGLRVVVTMLGYDVFNKSDQPNSANHAFVHIRDTDSGRSWIARGGPSARGTVEFVTGALTGTLKTRAEVTDTRSSFDTFVIGTEGKDVAKIFQTTIDSMNGPEAVEKAETYAQSVNDRKGSYGLGQNSNSVAFGFFGVLTGSRPDPLAEYPGSETDILRPKTEPPQPMPPGP
jgi:RHS repeat-associated protein